MKAEILCMCAALVVVFGLGVIVYYASVDCRRRGGVMLQDGRCIAGHVLP